MHYKQTNDIEQFSREKNLLQVNYYATSNDEYL